MTLRLYLDDCADSHELRSLLAQAGHVVVIPVNIGLSGTYDHAHFAYARAHGLTLITKNPRDFLALHQSQQDHAGILLIYQDNILGKDMEDGDIARAIQNLVEADMPFAGQAHTLNHWRY